MSRNPDRKLLDNFFHFEDKGNRPVALGAELTPTLARMVAAGKLSDKTNQMVQHR